MSALLACGANGSKSFVPTSILRYVFGAMMRGQAIWTLTELNVCLQLGRFIARDAYSTPLPFFFE